MGKWYENTPDDNRIVVNSGVRLARNITNYRFSTKSNPVEAKELTDYIKNAFFEGGMDTSDYHFKMVSTMTSLEKGSMLEYHQISENLAKKREATGVIMSEDASISIMINEEDHIRIQGFAQGGDIKSIYDKVDALDDYMSTCMEYAYDDKYGFITTSPSQLGTGLKVSYMLHLYCAEKAGFVSKLSTELAKYGFRIENIYPTADNKLRCGLYLITNSRTLGLSEKEILRLLNAIAVQVEAQERSIRDRYIKNEYISIEDSVYRAYGTLKYAKVLSLTEALNNLSVLRLGLCEHIVEAKEESSTNIYKLMMDIMPANLNIGNVSFFGALEDNQMRAEYVRNHLPEIVE